MRIPRGLVTCPGLAHDTAIPVPFSPMSLAAPSSIFSFATPYYRSPRAWSPGLLTPNHRLLPLLPEESYNPFLAQGGVRKAEVQMYTVTPPDFQGLLCVKVRNAFRISG